MAKKLTRNVIKNKVKQENELAQKKVVIDGEEFIFEYNINFSVSKISTLVDDYMSIVRNSLPDDSIEIDFVELVDILRTILVIKHFTKIAHPKTLKELLAFYLELLDAGIILDIMSVFKEENLKKVDDALSKVLKMQADELNKINETLEESIQEALKKKMQKT